MVGRERLGKREREMDESEWVGAREWVEMERG